MDQHSGNTPSHTSAPEWRRFVFVFLGIFAGGFFALCAFIALVDPYDVVPFSLPMDRKIVSISQRYMYPQIVRSKRFDSLVIGTSTSRLIDPEILNKEFGARFANLAMDSMTAWEQAEVASFFMRKVGSPKALIVGIDTVWCNQEADKTRITPRGFPEWLYDDNPANDFLYLFNFGTLQIAARMAGNKLGLYRERIRYDGFGVFVPPDDKYDLEKARSHIWSGARKRQPPATPVVLTGDERNALRFPALDWLNTTLEKFPASTEKLLVFMPVHIAAQPAPGSRAAAIEDECKSRISEIGRRHGARVADWRIASSLTTTDSNYWDPLHYRLPIAQDIARKIGGSIRAGQAASDGLYRLVSQQ